MWCCWKPGPRPKSVQLNQNSNDQTRVPTQSNIADYPWLRSIRFEYPQPDRWYDCLFSVNSLMVNWRGLGSPPWRSKSLSHGAARAVSCGMIATGKWFEIAWNRPKSHNPKYTRILRSRSMFETFFLFLDRHLDSGWYRTRCQFPGHLGQYSLLTGIVWYRLNNSFALILWNYSSSQNSTFFFHHPFEVGSNQRTDKTTGNQRNNSRRP